MTFGVERDTPLVREVLVAEDVVASAAISPASRRRPDYTQSMKTLASLLSLSALSALLLACSSTSSGTGGGACGSIAGTYAVTEQYSASCASTTAMTDTRTVTVTGADVKVTNGTTYLVKCTLSGCDCSDSSGTVLTFTATGFSGSETSTGCTVTTTATKK